jgi:hypothetical protein
MGNLAKVLLRIVVVLVILSFTLSGIVFVYLICNGENLEDTISFTVVLIIASIPVAIEIVCTTTLALGSKELSKVRKSKKLSHKAFHHMSCVKSRLITPHPRAISTSSHLILAPSLPHLTSSSRHLYLISPHPRIISTSSHLILASSLPHHTSSSRHLYLISPHPRAISTSSHLILASSLPHLTSSSRHLYLISPHPRIISTSSHLITPYDVLSHLITTPHSSSHFTSTPSHHSTAPSCAGWLRSRTWPA